MNVLFIGDIVSSAGREVVKLMIAKIKNEYKVDFIIANAENSAGGFGITKKVYKELIDIGIDLITMGNHTWDNKEVLEIINNENIIRPINFFPFLPGKGIYTRDILAVINIQGRTFLDTPISPIISIKNLMSEGFFDKYKIIIVDFHGEATAEKMSIAYYLDGKITAFIGTHTHVQTNDAKILPNGTFYISDIGMCGSYNSIIGFKIEKIMEKLNTGLYNKFEPEKSKPYLFCAVLLFIDDKSFKIYDFKIFNEIVK